MPTIKGYFAYSKLQNPVPKFDPKNGNEYTVDVVISKKDARAWKKKFTKQPPREVPTEEFEERYKFPAPFPNQDDQYVIKFRQQAEFFDKKTKEQKPITESMRIRVFLGKENSKGKTVLKDVTDSLNVGNGSFGLVQYRENESSKVPGVFARADAIRIDDLIEYQTDASYDELGELDQGASFDDEEDISDQDDDEGDLDDDDNAADEEEDDEEELY